jgi:hypothetical protein
MKEASVLVNHVTLCNGGSGGHVKGCVDLGAKCGVGHSATIAQDTYPRLRGPGPALRRSGSCPATSRLSPRAPAATTRDMWIVCACKVRWRLAVLL